MRLEVKRIDKVRIPTTGKWEISDSIEPESADKEDRDDKYAEYAEYAFVVRRKMQQPRGSDFPIITTKILIRSDCLKRAIKNVVKDVQKLSWNAQPFKVSWFFSPLKLDPDDHHAD